MFESILKDFDEIADGLKEINTLVNDEISRIKSELEEV